MSASNLPNSLALSPEIPVDNTLGAWLIGSFCSVFLSGIIYLQAYQYWRNFPEDPRLMKIWVGVVIVLETFTTFIVLHTSYYYIVAHYWNPLFLFLAPPVWSTQLLPLVGFITGMTCQCFFARRVWMMSRKFRPVVIAAALMIAGYGACYTVISVKLFKALALLELFSFSWLVSAGSAIQMGADLTITGSLVYILGHFRTGFKRTDARLDLLIAYALSTGLFTCLFHVLNVIASAVWQRNLIWMVPTSVLFKLYANNFLVALNSRKALGIMGDEDERTSHSSHNQHNMGKTADSSRNRGIDGRAAQTAPVQLRIMQHTTSETHMDSVDLETKSKGSPDDVVHIV